MARHGNHIEINGSDGWTVIPDHNVREVLHYSNTWDDPMGWTDNQREWSARGVHAPRLSNSVDFDWAEDVRRIQDEMRSQPSLSWKDIAAQLGIEVTTPMEWCFI